MSKQQSKRTRGLLSVVAVSSVLAACGGGTAGVDSSSAGAAPTATPSAGTTTPAAQQSNTQTGGTSSNATPPASSSSSAGNTTTSGQTSTTNHAPTISGTAIASVPVGSLYTFLPSAQDADKDPLTFSITNKPTWASFDTTTGKLSGTPTSAGTYSNVVISVSDGKGGSASLPAFTINVSVPTTVADLCTGLVTGKSPMKYSALTKPAKGQAVTDPDFGTRIVRVTDVQADWGSAVAIPVYPTIPTWNIDESLMVLYVTSGSKVGHALFDGKTYAFKRWLDINPADVEQFYWSSTDPDVLFYVDNTQSTGVTQRLLTKYHVSTGVKEVIRDFMPISTDGNLVSGGEDPFYTSYDNDLFGLGVRLNTNGPGGASNFRSFTYRISTNTVVNGPTNEGTVPQASPSGRYLYYYTAVNSPTGGTWGQVQVLDTNGQKVRSLAYDGYQHSDMLKLSNGQDVVAGAQFDGPSGSGTLMVANLDTGGVTTIIGEANGDPYPPSGTLVSGKALKAPGWVAVGVTGTYALSPTYLTQEILLANVETGKVCRAAHHRTRGADGPIGYWAQPNVTLSPSGTRIVFQSDWGSGSTVDTYVLELPSYKP